jgi:hypothetical protein
MTSSEMDAPRGRHSACMVSSVCTSAEQTGLRHEQIGSLNKKVFVACIGATAPMQLYLLDSAPDEGLEFGVLFFSRSRASCSMFSDLQHVRQTFFNAINQMAHLSSHTHVVGF